MIDRDDCWIRRFNRDDKAWVRDPKVFMDRGMPIPNGEPSLLKELRHFPQEVAKTIRHNLNLMGWKQAETLLGALPELNLDG